MARGLRQRSAVHGAFEGRSVLVIAGALTLLVLEDARARLVGVGFADCFGRGRLVAASVKEDGVFAS